MSHICALVVRVVLIASLVAAAGCDIGATAPEPAAIEPTVQVVTIEAEGPGAAMPATMLPAYETEAEKLAGAKNDAADDYRNQNRKWFAQTVAPEPGRFRPFGEWEEMQGVWTTYSNGTGGTKPVRKMMALQTINFIRHSKPRMKAYVIVSGQSTEDDFINAVTEFGITAEEKKELVIVQMPNQTIWHIDYGPFPIIDKQNGNVAFTDFVYYPNRYVDDAIPERIGSEFYQHITTFKMPFPFEGGNIQADGHGLCMTSNRALKNTGFSQLKVRNLLKKYAGCEDTVIVQDISDDGTGHIDMFFKWVSADHVMFGKYEDTITLDYNGDGKPETMPLPGAVHAQYANTFKLNQKRMEENSELMANMTSPATGKKIKVSRLSMMTALRDDYGYLPRTFINSTFANGVNVYPSYAPGSCQDPDGATCMLDKDCQAEQYCAAGKCTGFTKNSSGQILLGSTKGCDEVDPCYSGQKCVPDPLTAALRDRVQKQWETAMPDYKHVGLHADRIALWSGAIHCITRTIPNKPFTKAVHDGLCLGGKCGCVEGGFTGTCAGAEDCVGPEFVCNCAICKGTCDGGTKGCTDDADCSTDGQTVVAGSCKIDPNQACKGETAGAANGTCGSLAWEGTCDGKVLKYCSSGKAKQIACPNCCGWDASEKSYSCLSTSACSAATVKECDTEGQKDCSLQATHAWQCAKDGESLKRQWLWCENGTTCADGACVQPGGGSQTCPPDFGKDAGSTDTSSPAPDTGSSSGGVDGGPEVSADAAVVGPDGASSSGGTAVPQPAGGYGGCCTAPSSSERSPLGLLLMGLIAFAAIFTRRLRVVK